MKLERILVPLGGAAIDADVVRLAAALAKPPKAEVVGVHVIEVPWNKALDAVLEAETARGESLLSHAEEVARAAGVKLQTELLQARTAWSAIVDEAEHRSCDLIIIGMPFRRRMGKVAVGGTVERVFVNARCQVLALREQARAETS